MSAVIAWIPVSDPSKYGNQIGFQLAWASISKIL
jgi:hypothetical protein